MRYEGYRLRQQSVEKGLMLSILEQGIREPLEGVGIKGERILLNGFKRYRCAVRLGISIVPYKSIGAEESMGILHLLRQSNAKGLSIVEQARLVEELRNVHQMSVTEIAGHLERSKSWVSVRIGVIGEMSEGVRAKIFSGNFPVYSYMYTVRQFMRINRVNKEEVSEFIEAVSGKKLSVRQIEHLAHGYFKGSDEFREQIRDGNITWVLERFKEVPLDSDLCNDAERGMLRDLEIFQKYMQRIMSKSNDKRYKNNAFYAQANYLAGAILSKVSIFIKILKDFYDTTGQA